MIRNRDEKIGEITGEINGIANINEVYRSGPDLYFYKKLYRLRSNFDDSAAFLNDDCHMELLYATLVAWDMNSRGAKMKYFDSFRNSILSCLELIEQLWGIEDFNQIGNEELNTIMELYTNLHLMKTSSKLVSNSKLLHFLFPKLLMPMDGKNTLAYIYGNNGESLNKYIEIITLSWEIMGMEDLANYLDDGWNTTVPKIIDNAIILIKKRDANANPV